METNAKYLLVGVSVIVLFLALAGSIVWLRRSSSDAGFQFYEVYFQNQSLAGLREGSAVTMKGIPVGGVRLIEFDDRDSQRIRVILAVNEKAPVKMDTAAVVSRNLVTGLSTIDLSTGSSGSNLLDGSRRMRDALPILAEGATPLEAIRASAPALLERSADALAKLQSLLSDENRARIERTLVNIETMSSQLSNEDNGTLRLIADLRSLANQVGSAVETLKDVAQTANRSIIRLTGQVGDATQRLTTSVTDAARRVSDTAQRFQDPGRIITGPDQDELGPGERASKER